MNHDQLARLVHKFAINSPSNPPSTHHAQLRLRLAAAPRGPAQKRGASGEDAAPGAARSQRGAMVEARAARAARAGMVMSNVGWLR